MDRAKLQAFIDDLNELVKKHGLIIHGEGMPLLTVAPVDGDLNEEVSIHEDIKNNRYFLDEV